MTRIEKVLLLVFVCLVTYVPILALAYGVMSMLFENPKGLLHLFLIYGAIGFVMFVIYRLVESPKTTRITQTILWALFIAFFIHACNHSSHSAGGCIPSRYVDCD